MNLVSQHRLDPDRVEPNRAAFYRGMAFAWLALAAAERRIAASLGRSPDPKAQAGRRNALAVARANLARVRDRDALARAYGLRLP